MRQQEAGFTLIEVVVALVVLALGVAAAFGAINARGRSAMAGEAVGAAVMVARSVLDATGEEAPLADGEGISGSVRWQRRVLPVADSEPPFRLYSVTVTADRDGRSVSLTTLKAKAEK